MSRAVSRPWRTAIALLAATSIAGVGLIDNLTGLRDKFSLDVLYLVPIVVGTSLVSANIGFVLAVEASAAWVWTDAVEQPVPVFGDTVDAILRVAILGFVVLLVAALKSALKRAVASEAGAREFFSFAAHQVRTPLAGVQAASEALILAGADEAQERLLSVLSSEARRAGRLVGSMLQMATLDEGQPRPASRVDVTALCRGEVEALRARLREGIDLRFRVLPEGPPPAIVSAEALREALANILDNAGRHAVSAVDVELTFWGGAFSILVRDDGPGVPTGLEERIFERFVSVDGSDGVGLGLTIARSLVATQHGTLIYRDGAFVITIPLQSSGPVNGMSRPSSAPLLPGPAGSEPRGPEGPRQ